MKAIWLLIVVAICIVSNYYFGWERTMAVGLVMMVVGFALGALSRKEDK